MLIVQTSVESSIQSDTVLIEDDTDLLVLLCYHATSEGHELFFHPGSKKHSKTTRVWNIKSVKSQLGSYYASTFYSYMQ